MIDDEDIPEGEQPSRWEPKNDNEHLEEIKGLDSDTLAHLKLRARKSLYFMAKGVMGYKDITKRTHGRFCKFIEDHTVDRKLELMPRGHLKSSIATEADGVRLAVDDPDHARILIINEVLDNAKAFLSTIRAQFEKNKFLQALFPELVLSRFSGPGVDWSGMSATLPRSTAYKEPTWMPLGIGGAATSKHFSHIKVDDMIGLKAKASPADLKAAIAWNRNIESLAIDARSTIIEWIGTRWGKNDAYADIIDRYKDDLKIFHRSVIENGEIIFPEKYDWRFLNRIKNETPDIWMAQYMNDPTSDMTLDFNADDLRYFQFDHAGNVIFKSRGGVLRWSVSDLDRVLTADPNGGSKTAPDEAAIVVSGQAPDENVFTLSATSGRPNPDEFVDQIFKLAIRWRPRVVGIEQAGQQNTIFHFEKKMRKEGVFFNVVPLKHLNRVKEDRIRTMMQPVMAVKRLHVLKSQTKLVEQIKNYPDIKNDDLIDALAYAFEHFKVAVSQEQQQKNSATVRRLLARRSTTTGYSPLSLHR